MIKIITNQNTAYIKKHSRNEQSHKRCRSDWGTLATELTLTGYGGGRSKWKEGELVHEEVSQRTHLKSKQPADKVHFSQMDIIQNNIWMRKIRPKCYRKAI